MQDVAAGPATVPTSSSSGFPVTLDGWRAIAKCGSEPLRERLQALVAACDPDDPAWIRLATPDEIDDQLVRLGRADPGSLLLHGVPFAIKDNIDAAGMATTAGCPDYSYLAEHDATAVRRLKAVGAVLIGKTNLDQFATGLVGTRSPYGAVPNPFDPARVSGGSSSGSAVAVARGLLPFALGTDTAGSGRVPAGLNHIVGLKPTRGSISTHGVVPACRSLDCVSIFAVTAADAWEVHRVLRGDDPQDPYSRPADLRLQGHRLGKRPRFAIADAPVWHGDEAARRAYEITLALLAEDGAELCPVDFRPMQAMAELLYGGPWVAERLASIREFMRDHGDSMHPVVREIIAQGERYDAVDVFRAEYKRAALAREIQATLAGVDALVVPTAVTFPTLAEVEAEPVEANSRLGSYTNFVNLSDCCALSLPAGFREDDLPFGITLIAPSWHDDALAEFGCRWQAARDLPLGALGQTAAELSPPAALTPAAPTVPVAQLAPGAGWIRLAVVGAHLRGMPLNHQLTERGGQFVEATATAACYRLYALPGMAPPKPGLVRVATSSGPIEVELWDLPTDQFGSFVVAVPHPLGIGTVELADGRWVKGFICEPAGIDGAGEITSFGGWRAYLKSTAESAGTILPTHQHVLSDLTTPES